MANQIIPNKFWRILLILMSLAVIALGIVASTKMQYRFSLDQFVLNGSKEFKDYEKFENLFPKGDKQIILGFQAENPINTIEEFQIADSLSARIQLIDGVKKVHFLTNIVQKAKSGPFLFNDTILPLSDSLKFHHRFKIIDQYADITPKFLSKDRKALCMYVSIRNDETVSNIRNVISNSPFNETYIVGKSSIENSVEKTLKKETGLLVLIGLVFLLMVFLVFYPSISTLLFFLWQVLLSVATLYNLLWIMDIELNVLSSTIPLLITILGVTDTIHIINASKNLHKSNSQNVFKKIGYPLLLTSITTALGFGVFLITLDPIIIEFSLLTILGITTSYFVARYFSPFILSLLAFNKKSSTLLDVSIIEKVYQFSVNQSRLVFITGTILLVFGSIYSFNSLSIDQKLYDQLEPKSESSQSIKFFKENFGGVRRVNLYISSNSDLLKPKMIESINRIENYLVKNYKSTSVLSINTGIKRFNRAQNSGNPKFYKIPENLNQSQLDKVVDFKDQLGLNGVISNDKKTLRLTISSKDYGSKNARLRNKQLTAFLNKTLPPNQHFYLGGPMTIQDKASYKITWLILFGILSALLLVAVLLGILYRSILFLFIGLIANALPVVSVLLIYSLNEISLNPTNVMLLSIVLGVAVDDTLYLFSTLRNEHATNPQELSPDRIENSVRSVAKPVILTTLLLMSGFFTFYFSSFSGNQTSSLYFMFALLIALLADLLFIPACLALVYRSKSKTT